MFSFTMIGASFSSALEAVWANRLRSVLTMLGIFIGVAAVIGAFTLTQGVSQYITDKFNSLGTNTVIVYPGMSQSRGVKGAAGSLSTLTQNDVTSILKLPHVSAVSPFITVSKQVTYASQNWSTNVEGVNVSDMDIQSLTVAQGSWFAQQHNDSASSVAVLGDTVYQNLFTTSGDNPIGKSIRIGDTVFRVIGVLSAKGSGQDDVIYIPFNTARIRLKNTNYVDEILVQADSSDTVATVQSSITKQLETNHKITNSSNDDFQVFNFSQILKQIQQTVQILTVLLVGIAGISLSVGGIGIMNIMLVSVTERTREIGLRMAVGARGRDIRNQFLIEALVLCLGGSLVGLLLGLLIGYEITSLAGLPYVVTVTTIAIPVGVSIAITLIFGIYPAARAARLNPIEALRVDE
jgi:putative ABC transport system permease protein